MRLYGVIVGARQMGRSIYEVAMQFRFSRTTILRLYREYRAFGKASKPWKNSHWRLTESLSEIDMQHYLKLSLILILGHLTSVRGRTVEAPSLKSAFGGEGSQNALDCMAQSFTLCLCPIALILGCWWLETRWLVWRVSYPIISGGWMCKGMDRISRIHGLYPIGLYNSVIVICPRAVGVIWDPWNV